MTTTFPTASVVSRALRRDVLIITRPSIDREGYSVSRGLKGISGPSIFVSISDAEANNKRAGRELLECLRDVYGWDVRANSLNDAIIEVRRVPSKDDAHMHAMNYQAKEDAETKRRIAAAERASKIPAVIESSLGFLGGAR